MCGFEARQVQNAGGATSADTYGYITSTCMFWDTREKRSDFDSLSIFIGGQH
jgi:hypothetical protein